MQDLLLLDVAPLSMGIETAVRCALVVCLLCSGVLAAIALVLIPGMSVSIVCDFIGFVLCQYLPLAVLHSVHMWFHSVCVPHL